MSHARTYPARKVVAVDVVSPKRMISFTYDVTIFAHVSMNGVVRFNLRNARHIGAVPCTRQHA